MEVSPTGRGRIWLDVTTTMHAAGKFDGTTRVERSLARELPAVLGDRLGFCAFNRTTGRFGTVERPAQPGADATPGRSRRAKRRNPVLSLGKVAERALRKAVKAVAARVAATADRLQGRGPFEAGAAGDVLLLAGENWGRHDFDVLRRLRDDYGLRIAAVLQDMIPVVHPEFFEGGAFVARFQEYVEFLAEGTDLVLAISDCTRDDFLKAAPTLDPARVPVVELGAEFAAVAPRRPEAIGRLGGKPFVLSVSTIQVRKNFDLLYRLWQKFAAEGVDAPHLVIVGREGFGSGDLLHQMRNDPSIAGTVSLLHHTSDAELDWLYANCLFTLYPSWYEGWGLPLSESLFHGKTFIASDRSSLPQAGQGLGVHVSPYDLISWQREVTRLAADPEARAAMERRIASERRLASWADCAQSVAGLLERLSGSRN